MGLRILSPRSCLSGIAALHPIAACVFHNAWPPQAELVLWRKTRGPKTARGPSEASSQVRKDKINAGGCGGEGVMNGVFQGYKPKLNGLKSMRWKDALTRCLLPERRMSQTSRPGGE